MKSQLGVARAAALLSVLSVALGSVSAATLRGTILDAKSQPVAGVTVAATGGLAAGITTAAGNWTIDAPNALDGASYTVTPTKTDWVFNPSKRTITLSSGEAVGDFTGYPVAKPSLSVNATNRAPVTMAPAVATAMLKIRLLALVGPANVTRLVLKETGTAPASSIGLTLWKDGANVTPAGTTVDATTKTWTFPLVYNLATNQYVDLEVQETCGTPALGKTAQVTLADAASVTSTSPVTGAFPYVSNAATVVGANYLVASATDISPAKLYAGTFQSLLKLRLEAVGVASTITGLKIKDVGTIAAANLSLQVLKGGALVDSTVSLDSARKIWTLTFKTALTLSARSYVYLEIQARPAAAAAGSTVCLEFTDATSVRTTSVVAGVFPVRSKVLTVDASPLVMALGYSVAPATMALATWTPMLKVRLEAINGPVTITGLKVKETGSVAAADATIEIVRSNVLFAHTITAWDQVNKIWTLTFATPLKLNAGAYNYLELRERVEVAAMSKTAQLTLVDATYVTTTAPVLGTFPLASKLITATPNQPIVVPSFLPSNVSRGMTVNFDGKVTPDVGTTIVSYDWDFNGDGTWDIIGSATIPKSYVFNAAGTFKATLRATDSRQIQGTGAVDVFVSDAKAPTVTAIARPSVVAPGAEVAFDGTAVPVDIGQGIVRYEWDFETDGTYDTTSATSAVAKFRYNTPGTYVATLKATDVRGMSGTGTVVVTVTGVATLNITGANVAPANAQFTDTIPLLDITVTSANWNALLTALVLRNLGTVDGTAVRFLVTSGGTVLASTTSYDATISSWGLTLNQPLGIAAGGSNTLRISAVCTIAAGGKTVQASLAAASSVQANAFITGTFPITSGAVLVAVPNPPRVTATANPTSTITGVDVVFGGSATAGDPGSVIATYDWDFEGDGNWDVYAALAPNARHAYPAAGTYRAALRVTDNRGLQATAYVTVTIAAPRPPTVTATATPATPVAGQNVAFNGTATPVDTGASIVRWEWDFETDGTWDTSSPNGPATNHVYAQAGTYMATLRVTDNRGIQATRAVTVTVAGMTPPAVTASANPSGAAINQTIAFDGTATTVDPGTTIALYEWDWTSDGTYDYSSATSPTTTHSYTATGQQTATLRATDNRGVAGTATVPLQISSTSLTVTGTNVAPATTNARFSTAMLKVGLAATGTVQVTQLKVKDIGTADGNDLSIAVFNGTTDITPVLPPFDTQTKTWTLTFTTPITVVTGTPVELTLRERATSNAVGKNIQLEVTDATYLTASAGVLGSFPLRSGVCVIVQSSLVDSPWRKFHCDSFNTGRGQGQGATGGMRWSYDCGITCWGSPTIAPDGTVCVLSTDGNIHGVDNGTGAGKWKYLTGSPGNMPAAPVMTTGGMFYVGTCDGKVYAMDSTNGTVTWSFSTRGVGQSHIHGSPGIGTDGAILVASRDGYFYSIDTQGNKKWDYHIGATESSPAVAADGTIYIQGNSQIYAFDQAGTVKWQRAGGGDSAPAIGADGTVYVSTGNSLYALDGATGNIKWQSAYGGSIIASASSPAIGADGTLYVGTRDGTLWAKSGVDGSTKWQGKTGGAINSSPAVANDGTVYVGSADYKVYAFDGGTGTALWQFPTNGNVYSSPAIDEDGTVYVASWDKKLYAIGKGTPPKMPSCTATANPTTVQMYDPVQFTGTATIGEPGSTIVKWEWDYNGYGDYFDATATQGAGTYRYAYSGTYYATLRVTDSLGYTAAATVTVTVTPRTAAGPSVYLSHAPYSIYGGDTVTFTATATPRPGTTVTKYEWDFNGDGVWDDTTTTPTSTYVYQYTGTGYSMTFTATVLATDSAGNLGMDTESVYVYRPQGPTVSLSSTPYGPTVGSVVTFTATVTPQPGTTITTYDWDFDDDGIYDQQTTVPTTTYTFTSAGFQPVAVLVTASNGGSTERTTYVNVR